MIRAAGGGLTPDGLASIAGGILANEVIVAELADAIDDGDDRTAGASLASEVARLAIDVARELAAACEPTVTTWEGPKR